eukprot:1148493-Pelagomonas_calceolata.AAC.1
MAERVQVGKSAAHSMLAPTAFLNKSFQAYPNGFLASPQGRYKREYQEGMFANLDTFHWH